MAVGDVTITATNLAAGASVQVQVATRCKVIFGSNSGTAAVHIAISSDGVTYYTIAAAGWIVTGTTGATSMGNNALYLPASYYVQATNTDTSAHDTAIFVIEY